MYITKLKLRNVRCFKDVAIDFVTEAGRARMVTLLLGRNGAGKSTLLRAIALGLCDESEAIALKSEMVGEFIRRNKRGGFEREASIEVTLISSEHTRKTEYTITTTVSRDASGREVLRKRTKPERDFPWSDIFVCGYGVNRGPRRRTPPGKYTRKEGLLSLFSDDSPLLDSEVALQRFELRQLKNKGSTVKDDVLIHLKTILGLAPSYRVDILPDKVLVHGPWGAMPFHALGDGYRGTSGWVLDFLASAMANDQLGKGTSPQGIVLIDEIDEHLHPSWQRSLIPTLKKRFPRVQFVGTTHSAMALVNLKRDELVLCALRNAVAEALHGQFRGPEARTADELLRSEWFGLGSTLDSVSEELLDRYRATLREEGPGSKEAAEVREEVRRRFGSPAPSLLDELSVQISATLQKELARDVKPEERDRLVREGAAELRMKLDQMKTKREGS